MQVVFVDRDGVINKRRVDDWVKSWQEFIFLPGAREGLALLTRQGFQLMIITNQRGVSVGAMTKEDLEDIHSRMLAELQEAGAVIERIYVCPHGRQKNQPGSHQCNQKRLHLWALRD